MIDPRLALVIIAATLTVWLGGETVKGAKWIGHKVKAGVHKIVHPHEGKP